MKIKMLPDGQLRYRYRVDANLAFEFSLLSEVGEPWQNDAKAALQRLREQGFDIEFGVKIEERPWVSDFANVKGRT